MKRNWKLLPVSPELFVDAMKLGPARAFVVVEHPLPDDAKVVRVGYSEESQNLLVCLESAEWPEVAPGERIPVVDNLPLCRLVT